YLRHLIVKKLEDYFYRKHKYDFAHIPRPLGSISICSGEPCEAYLYEWAHGTEGFHWEEQQSDGSTKQISLKDWDEFSACFASAGIDMSIDITDPDDGRISKNIIHQFPNDYHPESGNRSSVWKRIDFGYSSLRMDYDKLRAFLNANERDMKLYLRGERYKMLMLAVEHLTKGTDQMDDVDIGRLETLVGDYRGRTLRHFTSRGSSMTGQGTRFDGGVETLI
ncbi:MAG: hypothetical protein KJ709_04890, partial [Nanoarchaeota archaeon]|nr:hypothetical protein [Nanoarchaeota archaeon]